MASWTAYHDQLQQEMIALMTEPNWQNDSKIMTRLYGSPTASGSPWASSIVGQLKDAGADLGKTPKLDANGNIVKINGVTQYRQANEQLAELMSQFEKGRLAGEKANESRYTQLVEGNAGVADGLLGGITRSAYGKDASGNLTGTGGKITGGLPTYKGESEGNAQRLNAITGGYTTRENDVMGNFNQYGSQARASLGQSYDTQRGSAEQSLVSRGLGNTTIRSSALAGLDSQRNQGLAAFDQNLARERSTLLSGLRGDKLNSQATAAASQSDFSLQRLGAASSLLQQPLGVIERRTDTSPSLSDVASLSLQAGKGAAGSFAPAQLSALTQYRSGDRDSL